MATIVSDRTAIYSCAVIQGSVVAIFSAYTAVFVARYHYDLTLGQYASLFIPQIIAAVAAALFAAHIGNWLRAERAYRTGLACSLAGMVLLIATEWAERLPASYPLLLAATALVGTGVGLTFPFLRCYAAGLNPLHARRQILLMNALLAAGMTAAPLYGLITQATLIWWSLPLVLGVLLVSQMLLCGSLRAPPDGAPARRADRPVPGRFRAYPGLALLYGICAVLCLTAPRYLTGRVPSSHHLHLLELAEVGFWAALVAGGRVVFAIIDGMKSRQHLASAGVFMIGIIVLALSASLTRYDVMHVGIYLLAGIGCAALIPIDTRPGNEHIAAFPLAVTVGLMAVFPVGLGLSRFAYDNIQRDGLSIFEAFISVAVVGATACILLLPIILSWRTMGYFDLPLGRNSRLSAVAHAGSAGLPGGAAADSPPGPGDRAENAGRTFEPGGATALPDRHPGSSRPR
ncbi:MAG TPA: hypothetical protein VMB74_13750 [Streptosporangiaceae bacterium]|nr:hypothetical protein [Streptosporangiaceae bacterium]